jgi:hypothetical protein
VEAKSQWWAARKAQVEAGAGESSAVSAPLGRACAWAQAQAPLLWRPWRHPAAAAPAAGLHLPTRPPPRPAPAQKFGALPVPQWHLGRPVGMDSLRAATDAAYKALEPGRKLRLPQLPAQVTDSLGAFTKSLGLEGALGELKVRRGLLEGSVREGARALAGLAGRAGASAWGCAGGSSSGCAGGGPSPRPAAGAGSRSAHLPALALTPNVSHHYLPQATITKTLAEKAVVEENGQVLHGYKYLTQVGGAGRRAGGLHAVRAAGGLASSLGPGRRPAHPAATAARRPRQRAS